MKKLLLATILLSSISVYASSTETIKLVYFCKKTTTQDESASYYLIRSGVVNQVGRVLGSKTISSDIQLTGTECLDYVAKMNSSNCSGNSVQ